MKKQYYLEMSGKSEIRLLSDTFINIDAFNIVMCKHLSW